MLQIKTKVLFAYSKHPTTRLCFESSWGGWEQIPEAMTSAEEQLQTAAQPPLPSHSPENTTRIEALNGQELCECIYVGWRSSPEAELCHWGFPLEELLSIWGGGWAGSSLWLRQSGPNTTAVLHAFSFTSSSTSPAQPRHWRPWQQNGRVQGMPRHPAMKGAILQYS